MVECFALHDSGAGCTNGFGRGPTADRAHRLFFRRDGHGTSQNADAPSL